MKSTLILSTLLVASALQAGDWRQFRGPQGAGIGEQSTLPASLNSRSNIAWKISLPGRGLSSPIIVGDRVFVTSASGARSDRLHVLCFNANDGSKRWERQFWATGRTVCHEKISPAAPTPVSDGERVFALFSSNDLFCLDLDGNLLWTRGLMLDYPNASNSLGMSTSPVVADGTLVVQVDTDGDAFAAGLDVKTGLNRWKIERRKRANWSSPMTTTDAAGKTLVLLQGSGGVSAIEPASGREVWGYKDGASTVPSSTIKDGTLYIPSNGITAVQPGAEGPKQVWRSAQLRTGTSSPVVVGGRVLLANDAGVLSAASVQTGERLWQTRLTGPFTSSPVAAGNLVYLANEKGLVQVVDTSKPEGEKTGELDLGETILATPSIANDAIYFRSDGHIWKIAGEKTVSLQ